MRRVYARSHGCVLENDEDRFAWAIGGDEITAQVQLASRRALDALLSEPDRSPVTDDMEQVGRLALKQFSAKEIAVALGMSVDTVAAALVRLSRC